MLGFDKYWNYERQNDVPYMWAEANAYWYRGVCVAKLKGGSHCVPPEIVLSVDEAGDPVKPEPNGDRLRSVDLSAMIEANHYMLSIIEKTTVMKILNAYEKYKDKVDCFHVAFSGGKDSFVLLDLVTKALPRGSFVVVFGDTGMEFPDTYEAVESARQQCVHNDVPFHVAKSHLSPKESWSLFGPPSRVLRWCCSVHKSMPQALKLREITGKNDYVGLSFVGVRAHESATRAEYEYENFGKKVKGQYDFYPILEWTSAEVYLYTYANGLHINEAYKKGNSRAGCLVCPMSGALSEYVRRANYSEDVSQYVSMIRYSSDKSFSDERFADFMSRGAWKSRADGRFVAGAIKKYSEFTENGRTTIIIREPSSDWREWIKTTGWEEEIVWQETRDGFSVSVCESVLKKNPSLARVFRQVFRKAAYCVGCGVCAANCSNECISFASGAVKIDECLQCLECHNIPGGCLLYDSMKLPNGGQKMRSINSFTEHPPKAEWIAAYFHDTDGFFQHNGLGPDQEVKFKVFLADSGLSERHKPSSFARLVSAIGWRTDVALGLTLLNLVSNNPQFEWYVRNLDIGFQYTRKSVIDMLLTDGLLARPANAVAKAFRRITETPLGTVLRFGCISEDGHIVRTKCSVSDGRVVLYGLFKFAEKCNNFKEFTLATLLNDNIERDGVSPTRIFGLERDDMIPILLGLSARYPEFISASFTHDLEKITLAADRASSDVLELFREGTSSE